MKNIFGWCFDDNKSENKWKICLLTTCSSVEVVNDVLWQETNVDSLIWWRKSRWTVASEELKNILQV